MHLISRSISLRAHSKYPPKLFTLYFDSALRVVKRNGGGSKGVEGRVMVSHART